MPRVFLFPVTELVGIVNPVEFWGELTIAAYLVCASGLPANICIACIFTTSI